LASFAPVSTTTSPGPWSTTRAAEAEVAGSYDLPLPTRALLKRRDVDGAVAIGVIVTGQTQHDEAIAHAAFYALTQVALESDKPVGLGVTGPGQSFEQARARIDRAGAAVDAVVAQLEARAAIGRR
jgi:6,7-dimethyl-8-ribityllumazine synthase